MAKLTHKSDKDSRVPVAAIGTSAGGIQALQTFFEAIPADTGAAFAVVLHLDPEHKSDLAAILGARTAMPVIQVQSRIRIEPNHVYLIPPSRQLLVSDGALDTCEFVEQRGKRTPIDFFFRSLADNHGDLFAIIMTGAGSDGAAGVKAIREAGGLVLVQDPNEAEYVSMPRSAIATGCADEVLPLRALAERLAMIVKTKHHDYEGKLRDTGEDLLRAIFSHLKARTGHDFAQYKRATVLRRLARRMQVKQITELEDYLELLRENPSEVQALFGDLLISVTTFFRDPAAFKELERLVIPHLFEGKDSSSAIRVWAPGCATGEEAYSIAMLLMEEAARRDVHPQIQIFATDIDANALNAAREGSYPAAIETDVSEERLRRFFILEKDRYRVKRELRDTVLFALHNLTNDPPFSRLDMISCRNVLIYFDRDLQRQACGIFNYALNPGGYLFLGASENADSPRDAFTLIDRDARIYQLAGNLPAVCLPPLRAFGTMPIDARQIPAAQSHAAPAGSASSHKLALEELAPPSVLVDGSYRILHMSESAGRYLELPGGLPTANVNDLIRPELRLDLLSALGRAFERQLASVTAPVMVKFNGSEAPVHLQVRPVLRQNAPPSALVFFIEASGEDLRNADSRGFSSAEPGPDNAAKALAEELESTKTQLYTTRQEYESVIEELRAANEEMQSVGEEYRSTSEELETSREELQSINEELQATNQEMKLKIESISRAHSDLQNLISVTDVGTLFLDSKLRIRHFTPRVADLLNITSSDEGRPISDFTHRLKDFAGLGQHARKVLDDLSSMECEVESTAGRWYLMRMRPYRTVEDKIEGVVVTFVDITERRQTEAKLISERRLQLAQEATSLGIIDYDAETDELWFDARTRELWGLGTADAVNLEVFFSGIAEKDRPAAREAFARGLDPAAGGAFSVEFRLQGGDKNHWLRAVGKAFLSGGAKPQRASRLVGTIQDITAIKAWEAQQVLLLQELSHRVKNTLTIIMSMARQTLRGDTTPVALDKYEARLHALSDAHDLLVQTGWAGAEIGLLVHRLLAAYAATGQGRVTIEGPDLLLPPYLATPFAMLVHELATNAAKYGALGERGTVAITWRIALQRDGKLLDLLWRENGGPAVSAKRRPGFGSFLIEEGLPDAKVEQRFEPGGLVCRVELPI